MPSVTCTKIHKDPSGRIRVRFGKTEREFQDIASLREFVRDALTPETLQAIFLRLALDRQPSLGNVSLLEGRTIDVDFSRANWGTVS